MQESGKTLDLTEKVKDPAVKWAEFPESARTTATPNGQVIGFPAIVDNLALLYNKTLFDAKQVPYPTDEWTWDDFRAAAKKLTDPAEKIYGTAYSVSASEDTTWHFWPLLWQRGGSILSQDGKQAAFNSQAGWTRWSSCGRWRWTTRASTSTRPTSGTRRCSGTAGSR
ncbi:extracellular solute-binding protein [Nonomuraea rubra]|uniref:extracellular solute-binding protein n=1 Tax=Nonomuraea rubra TaxID=46180 RepID=UPI0031EFBB93